MSFDVAHLEISARRAKAVCPVPCTALVVVALVQLKLSQHCQLVIIILEGPGG